MASAAETCLLLVNNFRLGRGRDGPKRFLGQFEGILQTDGYAAYDQIGGTRMVHAACWAHVRRQFFEAVQLNPRDPVATWTQRRLRFLTRFLMSDRRVIMQRSLRQPRPSIDNGLTGSSPHLSR
jgi:hypothetical protein